MCKNTKKGEEAESGFREKCQNMKIVSDNDCEKISSTYPETNTPQKKKNLPVLKEPLYSDNRLPKGWYRKVSKRKHGKTAGTCLHFFT